MAQPDKYPEDALHVAVVSDDWGPLEPLVAFLRAQPQIAVVRIFDESSFPADLSVYAGMFMYIHPTMRTGTVEKLVAYTRSGGRMIIPHHGIASSKLRNPEWLDFVGIDIAPRDAPHKPWRVIADTTHVFVNLCPGHWITSHEVGYDAKCRFRGSPDGPACTFPALRFPDTEVFVNQQHRAGRCKTVLFGSRCIDPESGEEISQPGTGWMERSGAGWIFYFQPGHRAGDFQHPAYQQILLNCLLWDS